MKKTLFAFMALAAAFATTSCQSDEEFTQQPTGKPMVINAVAEGIGTGTRATMAYKYDILWSENDKIYVKSSANNATFILTEGKGTTEGTFACTSSPSPFASGDEVEAFYPASLIDSDGSYLWPANQRSATEVPMYSKKALGSTSDEKFSFASLGAVLQIVFNTTAENVTLKSITLKDDTNPLSGPFTVNGDGKAVMDANAEAPGITLDLGGTGKALGKGANYFNIAVPAGTYSNLSITFTATDNTVCTMKGSVTLNHNTVGKLTLTGFTPTAGCATANGIGYVKWVQLWKNGPKFAEFNVGASSATDVGTTMTFTNAVKTGAAYVWGANWCTPSKSDMEKLLNATSTGSVTCEYTQEGSTYGFKFTGNETGYTGNSVFFPAPSGSSNAGNVRYWSATVDGPAAWDMYLYYYYSKFSNNMHSDPQVDNYLVRPVLKN